MKLELPWALRSQGDSPSGPGQKPRGPTRAHRQQPRSAYSRILVQFSKSDGEQLLIAKPQLSARESAKHEANTLKWDMAQQ